MALLLARQGQRVREQQILISDLYQAVLQKVAAWDTVAGWLPGAWPQDTLFLAFLIGLFLMAVPSAFVNLHLARWRATGRSALRMFPLALVMAIGFALAAGSEIARFGDGTGIYLDDYVARLRLALVVVAAAAALILFALGSFKLTVKWRSLSRLGSALSLVCWLNVLFAVRLSVTGVS